MSQKQFYLGIDVGKYQHQATLINQEGKMIGESIRFSNCQEDFKKLSQTIKEELPEKAILKIGLESTGHYYFHLKHFLLEQGFNYLTIINPIETQDLAKTRIRKVRNDKQDSLRIAQIIKRKEIKPSFKENQLLRQLRELTRFSEKLKAQSRFYQQEISLVLERLCPEFFACFSHIFPATPMMIIRKYFLEKKSAPELIQLIKQTSRGRIKETKAKEMVDILDHSLGNYYRSQEAIFKESCPI